MLTAQLKRRALFALLLLTGQCSAGNILPALDSAWNRIIVANFQFLPEHRLEADLYTFLFHKNDYFKERYFLASDPHLSFSLLSFRNTVYSLWDFDFELGMGQTPGNIVFDPMDIHFGIVPAIELRLSRLITHTGLEHRCYHEIDRKNFPTVYLNKVFLAAGSRNFRLSEYRTGLIINEWTPGNRFSWYVRWGYFMKEFFGIIDPGKINGGNSNVHEFSTEMRYAFYRRKSWVVNAGHRCVLGQYDKMPGSAVYWRNDFSLESNLRSGIRGGMFFVRYTIDDIPLYEGMPRFSKDRLLQLGIKFYD